MTATSPNIDDNAFLLDDDAFIIAQESKIAADRAGGAGYDAGDACDCAGGTVGTPANNACDAECKAQR